MPGQMKPIIEGDELQEVESAGEQDSAPAQLLQRQRQPAEPPPPAPRSSDESSSSEVFAADLAANDLDNQPPHAAALSAGQQGRGSPAAGGRSSTPLAAAGRSLSQLEASRHHWCCGVAVTGTVFLATVLLPLLLINLSVEMRSVGSTGGSGGGEHAMAGAAETMVSERGWTSLLSLANLDSGGGVISQIFNPSDACKSGAAGVELWLVPFASMGIFFLIMVSLCMIMDHVVRSYLDRHSVMWERLLSLTEITWVVPFSYFCACVAGWFSLCDGPEITYSTGIATLSSVLGFSIILRFNQLYARHGAARKDVGNIISALRRFAVQFRSLRHLNSDKDWSQTAAVVAGEVSQPFNTHPPSFDLAIARKLVLFYALVVRYLRTPTTKAYEKNGRINTVPWDANEPGEVNGPFSKLASNHIVSGCGTCGSPFPSAFGPDGVSSWTDPRQFARRKLRGRMDAQAHLCPQGPDLRRAIVEVAADLQLAVADLAKRGLIARSPSEMGVLRASTDEVLSAFEDAEAIIDVFPSRTMYPPLVTFTSRFTLSFFCLAVSAKVGSEVAPVDHFIAELTAFMVVGTYCVVYKISTELMDPFGTDYNDLDLSRFGQDLTADINDLLLKPHGCSMDDHTGSGERVQWPLLVESEVSVVKHAARTEVQMAYDTLEASAMPYSAIAGRRFSGQVSRLFDGQPGQSPLSAVDPLLRFSTSVRARQTRRRAGAVPPASV
jgi:predicted membrane chloride channel (bestrophin family)